MSLIFGKIRYCNMDFSFVKEENYSLLASRQLLDIDTQLKIAWMYEKAEIFMDKLDEQYIALMLSIGPAGRKCEIGFLSGIDLPC